MPLLTRQWTITATGCRPRSLRHAARSELVLSAICLLVGCEKRDQSAEKSEAPAMSRATCPSYSGSTTDWVSTQTADGRLAMSLPPGFRLVQTDSGQLWAAQGASIAYRNGALVPRQNASTEPRRIECAEAVSNGAELRQYYAEAATGVGYYLQATIRVGAEETIRLIGFAEDSLEGAALLEVVRRATVGKAR